MMDYVGLGGDWNHKVERYFMIFLCITTNELAH